MRFYQSSRYPIRVYLDDSDQRVLDIANVIRNRFYVEDTRYRDAENDLQSLVFADRDGHPWIPLGVYPIAVDACKDLGYPVEVDLLPVSSTSEVCVDPSLLEGRTLRPYQITCVEIALTKRRGLIQASTGSGKTSMIAACTRYLLDHDDGNIVILVPTINLLLQTHDELYSMGITEIGCYGGGYKFPGTRVIISTVQTMYRQLYSMRSPDIVEWSDHLIAQFLDEAQHGCATTVSTVLDELQCEYMIGFSAEPFKKENASVLRDLTIRGIIGPILYKVETGDLIRAGYISKPYVYMIKSQVQMSAFDILNWAWVQKNLIVDNPKRNQLIIDVTDAMINADRLPLIVVTQVRHGQKIAHDLSKLGINVCFMQGGQKNQVYKNGVHVDNIPDTNAVKEAVRKRYIQALIGTSTIDEGYDLSNIRCVILAGGGKSKLKTIQRIGRGLRISPDDPYHMTVVIDFQDNYNLVTRSHARKRATVYNEYQYTLRYVNDVSSLINTLAFDQIDRGRELRDE